MKLDSTFIKAAGLGIADKAILKVLDAKPLSIAQITSLCKLPRSTVAYHLPLLLKRGLIRKSTIGKRTQWFAPEYSAQNPSGLSLPDKSSESTVHIYKGATEMKSLWYKILKFPKHSRLHVIQPANSLKQAIRSIPAADAIRISEMVKEHFVVDGITDLKAADVVISSYKQAATSKKLAKAFTERLEDIVKVPDDFLNDNAEINLVNDHVIIMNWHDGLAIDIHNRLIYSFMLSLYEKLKAYGNRYHHGKYIEEVTKRNLT